MAEVAGLAGLRILVVEDEQLIAMLLEDLLSDFGCVVVGPVGSVDMALPLAEAGGIDGALLDLNLGGQLVYPVADALTQRGIPVIFTSGYGQAGLIERYADAKTLSKPFDAHALESAIVGFLPNRTLARR